MRAQVSILLTIGLNTSATIFQASLQQLVRYVHPRSTWWQERNKIYIYNYTQDVHTVNRSSVVLQKPLYTSQHLLRLHYDSMQAGELSTRHGGCSLHLRPSLLGDMTPSSQTYFQQVELRIPPTESQLIQRIA